MISEWSLLNLGASGGGADSTWHLSPQGPGCPVVVCPHLVHIRGRVPLVRGGARELEMGRDE